ncbi:hypothetical protein SEUCBS139899_008367 [Sporothrix eucalyptigena]
MDTDAPPAKRRRTSPRLSNRSTNEPQPNTNDDATTTPPDGPPQATTDSTDNTSRPRPPSFASPTRASLARHNPAILERRESVPRESIVNDQSNDDDVEAMIDEQLGQSSAEKERETNVRPLARPAVRSPVRSPARLSSPTRPLAQPALRSPVRLSRSRSRSPTRRLFGGAEAGRGDGSRKSGLFGAPPQKSPEAARSRQIEGLATGNVASSVPGSLLGEPPRRSPIKPIPRPLPPPDPQRSQDLLEPLVARTRQRSALDLFRVQEEAQPEPELPPTPEGVDQSSLNLSPPGIHHSSTPTKKPRRAARLRGASGGGSQKSKPGTVQSSSPLKQPPLKPSKTDTAVETEIGNSNALQEASTNIPTRGRGRPRKSDAARNVQPSDEDTQRAKERDALEAEIAGLEADLALAAAENARIRDEVERGNGRSSSNAPTNQREIISLLRRRVLPEAGSDETTSASMKSTLDWLQAATNPMAFLPFGKPRADVTELLQFGGDEAASKDGQQAPLVSHHPIEMTAAEELPFLQAFTPLAFRSEIVVLFNPESDGTAAPALQKHIITASSTTPPGLFLARIEMTVHSKNLRIIDLAVPRIEPPAAAAELKPLFDRITGDNNGSSALTRNITVLTWAMGEWVRVAVRRAKFWSILARKLRDKDGQEAEVGGIAGMVEDIKSLRAEQRKRKRRKGNNNMDADDNADDDDDDANERRDEPAPVSQTELLEHLGRTAMDIEVSSSSSLRVEWLIQFDWTGEAKSQIGLLVGVPGKWRKADKRGRLARLPKLFDQLVQDSGDPMAAVQTVVALLAGEEDN